MKIKSIQALRQKPKLVCVTLDNDKKYTIRRSVALKFELRKGDNISENELNEIIFEDEFSRAKDLALKYFSYNRRTEYELKNKLLTRKFNPKVVEAVIKNLICIGLVNDIEYCENFAENILKRKPIGRNLLQHRLLQKGIPKEVANRVLEKTFKNMDETKIVFQLARKQLKKYKESRKKSTERQNHTRLISFLARRGFSREVISRVLRKLFQIQIDGE